MNDEIITLNPGNELYIPFSVAHSGERIAGIKNNACFWRKKS